jgi:hypothetical protein
MKFLKYKYIYFIIICVTAITLNLLQKDDASASMGVCGDAAESGVCVGDGAKCVIKKGIFRKSCGKDPNGGSIILN